jgi:hypothetical protein
MVFTLYVTPPLKGGTSLETLVWYLGTTVTYAGPVLSVQFVEQQFEGKALSAYTVNIPQYSRPDMSGRVRQPRLLAYSLFGQTSHKLDCNRAYNHSADSIELQRS